MTRRRKFGYVYGGTAVYGGQTRALDGTAWSLGPCDEVRLRAVAARDLAKAEGVPLAGMEITEFWYSEIVTEDGGPDRTEGADPFRPHGPDPFSPVPGDT
ncbi:hypothetical protein ACH4F6_38120 [Streptomyces sp. NPDC017936]|uniref:hypothetical protein n=1 Tax=Streptomyces sp. NPDC017936 TaxID=3365016 RepID=UPI00378AB3B7